MAQLNKEIWISQLMEKFYPDTAFLNHVRNMSELVEYDKINLAEAGMDPKVLINNTTYPVPVVKREDKPIAIELDLFETENTIVRRPETIEYSYNQLESVIMGHRNSLRVRTGEKAAHAIAPQKDDTYTPVIETTGNDDGSGKKQISTSDILRLKRRFDEAEVPLEMRYLVLNPRHVEQLLVENVKLYKDISNHADGSIFRFAGFNILEFTRLPKYDLNTGEKVAFGAESTESHTDCSIAFYGPEVMRADGSVFMYANENDPEQRGTIVGFDKRFICMPIRNKKMGAIVTSKVGT